MFEVRRETKQGDPLSSLLINTEALKDDLKEKSSGICLSDCETRGALRFSTSLEQLEKMLCHFKQSIEKVGQKIHPGKTKILSNQSSKKKTEVSIDNIKVEILYCPRKKAQHIMDKQLHFSNKR